MNLTRLYHRLKYRHQVAEIVELCAVPRSQWLWRELLPMLVQLRALKWLVKMWLKMWPLQSLAQWLPLCPPLRIGYKKTKCTKKFRILSFLGPGSIHNAAISSSYMHSCRHRPHLLQNSSLVSWNGTWWSGVDQRSSLQRCLRYFLAHFRRLSLNYGLVRLQGNNCSFDMFLFQINEKLFTDPLGDIASCMIYVSG